jgi:hypothetical protein
MLKKIKKFFTLMVFLFLGAFIFQSTFAFASASAKTEKPGEKNNTNTHRSELSHPHQYLNFCFPPVLPTLFFPNPSLNLIFLADAFNFQKLKMKRPKKRFGRAVLEGLGNFAYSTSSYWIRQDVMKEDWEYQFTWEDQKKRFLFIDGMRFDSNNFTFNWTHAGAGAIYYNYARANRLNPLESFLYSFGASYFWEFFIEFKEVVSINDVISTPMGGISIGESLFQLGRLFRSRKPTFLNKIARFFSNPILSLNEWLDRKKYKNQYAFDMDYWNDSRVFFGPRFDTYPGSAANSFLQLGLESQINLIPEYGQPGASSRAINHTAFTEFDIQGALNRKGLYEFSIFAKSVLFGYFKQNIHPAKSHPNSLSPNNRDNNINRPDDDTAPGNHEAYVGYSLFWGLATCFEGFRKDPIIAAEVDFPERMDKFCIINLLGPTVDFSLFQKDLKVRLVADAYGDFSLIHSLAFKKYSQLNEFGQTKSTLENHGYYYALGITLSSMLQVNYSNLELKGIFKYHYFDSIEGLDRFQKDMADEDDFDLKDQRWRYNISLGYRIPHTPVQLVLGTEHWDRKGRIGDFQQKSTENRSYFQIKYLF